MQKIFILFTLIFALLSYSAANGVIGPELEKALENSRGKLSVIITLKKQFEAEDLISNYMVRGEGADVKKQVFDILKNECQTNQHFLNSLCTRLESNGRIDKVHSFWLANAISLEGDADAIREFALQSDVQSISLDVEQQMINPLASTNTEETRSVWGLDYIKSKTANQQGLTGQGVTVAIVDTGIDTDHSAFRAGQVLTDKCASFVNGEPTVEDGNGHGTHCAGTIGSFQYGVAPDAKLIGVKVLSSSGSGTWDAVMKGTEYGAANADVISMSLGGTASANGNVVETAVKNAIQSGTIVVIAAGNSGPWGYTTGTPGVVKEAITVGAIDSSGNLAYFSSRGPTVYGDEKPEIVAPGVNVLSAWKNGGTNTISGTSMATPHVAGLCALYLSKNKGAKQSDVKSRLMATAFGKTGANEYGAGTVDCVKANNADIDVLSMDRASKEIEFVTDGSGNVTKSVNISVPWEIKINGIEVTCDFANVNVNINGQNIYDAPLKGGAKKSISTTLKSGENSIQVTGAGASVKGGTVKAIVHFSLWK